MINRNNRDILLNLAQQIKDACPQLADYQQSIEQKAVVSDIQHKLAEIYGLIHRENENPHDGFTNEEAIASIVSIIRVVALAVKTKLNLAEKQNLLDEMTMQKLNDVVYASFNVSHTLSGKDCPFDAPQEFAFGLVSRSAVKDYKTGLIKIFMPGSTVGQIVAMPFGNSEQVASYLQMIIQARKLLDNKYNPSPDQIWVTKNISEQQHQLFNVLFKGSMPPSNDDKNVNQHKPF